MQSPWLVILPYVPYPLTRGTYQRVFHLTRALGEAVAMDLFCLAEAGEGLDQEHVFTAFTRRYHAEPFQHPPWPRLFPGRLMEPLPSTVTHWRSAGILEALRRFTSEQEYAGVAFCDLVLWPYVKALFPAHPVRVMDRSRVDWLFQTEELATLRLSAKERFLRRENLWKIRRLERSAYRELAGEVVCGPDDKTFLSGKLPDVRRIHVLANGYNARYFDAAKWPRTLTAEPSVLFCGALDYTPNRDCLEWYLEEIHGSILSRISNYTFLIVGRNPQPALKRLADRPGVRLVGEVPDVRPWYQQAWLQAVPLRIGGGTRLKITESLGMRTPVVSTTLGAQGLDLKPGRDIVLADDAAGFAEAVVAVLQDPGRRQELEESGLASVRSAYTWDALGAQYVQLLKGIHDAHR